MELFEREFIDYGGDETWLQGLDHIPKKLLAICEINKILAHRPWLLTPEHISALAKGPRGFCWTMSEVVHAIVILSHIHSLSSFVFSCGLTQELENASPIIPPPVGTNQSSSGSNAGSSSPKISNVAVDLSTSPKTAAAQKKAVDVLMAKMLNLSQQSTECSEDELIDRFKSVEMQTAELSPTAGNSPSQLSLPINVLQYIDDPGFTYVDFARRGVTTDMPPTFRVQDYSWDDHGYSLVNRLYNDVGFLLDVKFRATYNLTYCTMVSGGRRKRRRRRGMRKESKGEKKRNELLAVRAPGGLLIINCFSCFSSFLRPVGRMWTRPSSVERSGTISSASTGSGTTTTTTEKW